MEIQVRGKIKQGVDQRMDQTKYRNTYSMGSGYELRNKITSKSENENKGWERNL